jgi:hypothetical protein
MGTTLTGTTPQDTYDSLIKVTDNGPLSGTLKALSDGLGNDSALALSTTAASITGSLTTTAKTLAERVQVGTAATLNDATGVGNTLQFANYSPSAFVTASADSYIYKNSNAFGGLTSQSLVFQTRSDTTGGGFAFVAGGTPAVVATITSAGNVGIGTSEPAGNLHIASAADTGIRIQAGASSLSYIDLADTASGTPAGSIAYNHITNAIVFNGGGTNTEFARIDSSGNVGIGNSSPLNQLDLNNTGAPTLFDAGFNVVQNEGTIELSYIAAGRSGGRDGAHIFKTGLTTGGTEIARFTTNGLTFNGDTAAANALDDYEQGTFTATLKGSVSDPSTAVTTTGRYTKIGDVVSVRVAFASVDTTGASGDATIIGLPFTSSGISVGGATSNLFGFAGRTSISSYVNNSTTLSVFATSDGGSFTDIQHSAGAGRWLVCAITYFV